jgi:hypothetical protein
MQDAGCKPRVRVFRWPGSVLGARCPAFGVDSAPVPGTRSQVPGTRHLVPGTGYQVECSAHASKNPHTGYARCRIQDVRCRMHTPCTRFSEHKPGILSRSWPFIQVSGASTRHQLPGTWYRIPGTGLAPKAGYRAPRTENAHTGFASCILHLASCIPHPASETQTEP